MHSHTHTHTHTELCRCVRHVSLMILSHDDTFFSLLLSPPLSLSLLLSHLSLTFSFSLICSSFFTHYHYMQLLVVHKVAFLKLIPRLWSTKKNNSKHVAHDWRAAYCLVSNFRQYSAMCFDNLSVPSLRWFLRDKCNWRNYCRTTKALCSIECCYNRVVSIHSSQKAFSLRW